MKFLKNKICLIVFFVCLILFIFLSALSYTKAVCNNLSSNVFRLHVIANSDSKEDQELKLKVRDSIINYMNSFNFNTKNDAMSFSKDHLSDLKNIALDTISKNGYDYSVDIEIGNFNFPTKSYGDITLPAGYYDALRIKIGSSSGHNWWCVMFPPLCFVDITSGIVPEESKENLKENLSEEDYDLISSQSNSTNIKFKIVEWINNFTIKLAQN